MYKNCLLLTLFLVCFSCQEDEEEIDCSSYDLEITLSHEPSGCNSGNGTITASGSGGDGEYEYTLNETTNSSGVFESLEPGNYTVVVRDGSGCDARMLTTVTTGVSLTNDIMPIIEHSCTIGSCHQLLGPSLQTQDEVIANAAAIANAVTNGSMPPPTEPALTENEIELINCWVSDDAPDN